MNTNANVYRLNAAGIEVTLDLEVGHISSFVVTRGQQQISPFHRAPWIEETLDEATPPHLRRLSIDFFCAPFGQSDVEPAPDHGWSANSAWELYDEEKLFDGLRVTFVLARKIMSGTLKKVLTVRDGHPFLYQSHLFEGAVGSLPVAYHAMVEVPNGGLLSFSPKLYAETAPTGLEPDPSRGRSILQYPASSSNLQKFPRADGRSVNLQKYPLDEAHVDLVVLHEQPNNTLGWAIASRIGEGDMAIILKDPKVLPCTVLWFSNGGRMYAPWNGRHRGVLGIEEARTFFGYGHLASTLPNSMSDAGIETSLPLVSGLEVRTVIGAAETLGTGVIQDVSSTGHVLRLTDDRGKFTDLPFDSSFITNAADV